MPAHPVPRYGGPDFSVPGFVSIWVAIVPLDQIPEGYFKEIYVDDDEGEVEDDEDDDEPPLTRFYGDFGFGWFDHDYVEANRPSQPGDLFDKMVGEFSFSSSFAEAAVAEAQRRGFMRTDYIVNLCDFRYDPAVTGIQRSEYMEFLGSFPYDSKAASLIPYQG